MPSALRAKRRRAVQLSADPLRVAVRHLRDEPYANDDITKATSMEIVNTMKDLLNMNPLYGEQFRCGARAHARALSPKPQSPRPGMRGVGTRVCGAVRRPMLPPRQGAPSRRPVKAPRQGALMGPPRQGALMRRHVASTAPGSCPPCWCGVNPAGAPSLLVRRTDRPQPELDP